MQRSMILQADASLILLCWVMYWHVGNSEQNSLVFRENKEWRDLLMPVTRFFLRILRGTIAFSTRDYPARGPKPTIRVLFESFYVWKSWEKSRFWRFVENKTFQKSVKKCKNLTFANRKKYASAISINFPDESKAFFLKIQCHLLCRSTSINRVISLKIWRDFTTGVVNICSGSLRMWVSWI